MTKMAIKIIPVSDLRRKTSDVIKAVQNGDDVVYITQYGRPAAVLVDYDRYEMLMSQIEDLSDRASLRAAEHEPVRSYEESLSGLLDDLPTENRMMVEQFVRFLHNRKPGRPATTLEQPHFRYPTVPLPASSLDAWVNLLPKGYEGDALADTEALFEAV